MRFFLISDNVDTQVGMRLAGIEGIVVHTQEQVEEALTKAVKDPAIGIVLITGHLMELCRDYVYGVKMAHNHPLIIEIPDRHGTGRTKDSITRYVQEAVGVKM